MQVKQSRKQNPHFKSGFPLQSGEKDQHLPSRMCPTELSELPASWWADLLLPRACGGSDKEALHLWERGAPSSGAAGRQVAALCSPRALFVCGNHGTCRIRPGCCWKPHGFNDSVVMASLGQVGIPHAPRTPGTAERASGMPTTWSMHCLF